MSIPSSLKIVVPILWILIQQGLVIFLAILILRWFGLLKRPVEGLEYGQVVTGAAILLIMIGLANVAVPVYLETWYHYSEQDNWFRKILLQYTEYFMVVLLFECLFVGLYWFFLNLFFGIRSSVDSRISNGNLPLAILMVGILGGLGLGMGKALGMVLDRLMPSIILMN